MNVMHALPRIRLAEGGVVRAVLDMASLLADRGLGVTVLTWDDADAPGAWRAGGVRAPKVLKVAPPSRPGGLFAGPQLAAARAAIAGADVLHLHTPWEMTNLQLAGLARRAGRPYVVSVHGMLDDWCMSQRGLKKRAFLALAGRRMLNGAGAVHCTAAAERTQAGRWFDASRAVVIPLVFDLSDFRDPPGPGPARARFATALGDGADPVLLFLSRLHPKKGVELLIDAAAILRDRGRRFRLVIAGSGEPAYESELRARVSARSLGDRSHFVGLVTGRDKVSLFQAATVFVLPTSQENFGFVIPESLACATPAITTRGVDIWPDLEQHRCAVVVDPPTAEGFAAAAAALLDDPDRRVAMGRAGRDWVTRDLDPSAVAARFETLYAGLAR